MHNVAVIGSRDYQDDGHVFQVLDKYKDSIGRIISGGATGPDSFAVEWAKLNGVPYTVYEVLWDNLEETVDNPVKIKYNKRGKPYNALAGPNRNTKIVQDADLVLAFWDLRSPGTRDSINKATLYKKKLKIITIR